MPHVATSPTDLLATLSGSAHLEGDRLVIDDEAAFRDAGIRDLAWTAAFSDDEATTASAQWLVWEASQALGARSASIQALYDARARGEVSGFTVPAINLRDPGLRHGPDRLRGGRRGRCRGGHPRARAERADVHVPAPDRLRDVGAGRGDRRRLAGSGLHPGRPLPVQRQEVRRRPGGDDRGDPARLPAGDRRRLSQHRHRLLDARRPVEAQRRRGAARELPAGGRADRPDPDARAGRRHGQRRRRDRRGRHPELDGRRAAGLPRRVSPRARGAGARRAAGISKVSVQTGTSHGGVPLPDGGVAEVKLDFEVLRELGVVAREYGLAGAVQHGASTLPDELFHRFPAVETAEIHLATGFQNALYEHPAFPESLHREIEAWCFANAADERKPGQTDQQFVYTTRKKALGPFKRRLWELDDEGRDPGRAATQDLVPLHRAPRERHSPDGRSVRGAGRGSSHGPGCPRRRRDGRLKAEPRAELPGMKAREGRHPGR